MTLQKLKTNILRTCHVPPQSMKAPELKERLEESEKLIQEMTVTWEEKLRKTEEIAQVTATIFCTVLSGL